MAIISGIAGVAGRFAGRVLSAVLGWATILLFGKVSGSKQTVVLLIALASVVWVILVIGVLVPDVGTTLIAFIPVPSFISEDLVRRHGQGPAAEGSCARGVRGPRLSVHAAARGDHRHARRRRTRSAATRPV